MYERGGMGMSEVRAASGVPAGPPGYWWSRDITPEGESRHAEKGVSRNWSHPIGGGPLRPTPRFWKHPVGPPTDYPAIKGVGTDEAPQLETQVVERPIQRQPDVLDLSRSIRSGVEDLTGSRAVGEVVSCAAQYGVPGVSRYVPLLPVVPLGIGAAVYWWQRRRGVSRGRAAACGAATYVGLPLAFCLLINLIGPIPIS